MVYLLKLVKLMSPGEWDGDIWIMVTMALWPWLTASLRPSFAEAQGFVLLIFLAKVRCLMCHGRDCQVAWDLVLIGGLWSVHVIPLLGVPFYGCIWLYMAVWTPVNGLMTIANMGYGYIVQLSNAVSQCHALILAPEESDQKVMLSALAMPTSYSKFWT